MHIGGPLAQLVTKAVTAKVASIRSDPADNVAPQHPPTLSALRSDTGRPHIALEVTEIDPPYFRKARAPSAAELQSLVHTISERIGRRLERNGKLVRDEESSYLALESEGEGEDALKDLQGHSIQ